MKIFIVLLHIWLLCCQGDAQSPQKADPLSVRLLYRIVRDFGLNIFGRSATEPRYVRKLEINNKVQDVVPKTLDFPCKFSNPGDSDNDDLPTVRSETKPTSVHALRPGDIDIIAAMGDSLTAGNGGAASNILQVMVENKGISWSIGGQGNWRKYLTLPNIIKVFNPNLIGFSRGDAYAHHQSTQFNVAELGAMSKDLPHMARELVKRMYGDRRVNIKNDWKLVTLMMGANDFCLDLCYVDPTNAAENHKKELLKALKILKKNLPRTLINLVIAPDVTLLKNFTGTPPICDVLHIVECPCFFGEPNKPKQPMLKKIIKAWQHVEKEMETHSDLSDSDDFAVVSQNFVKNINFPLVDGKTDFTLMSTDCFHFSQKGYARASNALWNNMMEPVGEKTEGWKDTFERFLCPTKENPYIFTVKNSHKSAVTKPSFGLYDSTTNSLFDNLVKRGVSISNQGK